MAARREDVRLEREWQQDATMPALEPGSHQGPGAKATAGSQDPAVIQPYRFRTSTVRRAAEVAYLERACLATYVCRRRNRPASVSVQRARRSSERVGRASASLQR